MNLFDKLQFLERSLDFQLERHGVLASNLANVSTPGYRARDLSFEAYLEGEELETTQDGHLGDNRSENALVLEDEPAKSDSNSVRLERVMAQINANRVRYNASASITRKELAMLRYAATDGEAG